MHYNFSMGQPPRLSAYSGAIYNVTPAELQQVVGTAEYDEHTSIPTAPGKVLNTDKHVKLVHRFYWTLSGIPVRYAVDVTYKVKEVTGYTKTDSESTTKTLGASAGAKVFGISAKLQASLKITESETLQWHEEQTTEADKKYLGHHIYCTWTLVDDLETTVDTKSSAATSNKPAEGNSTRTESSFRVAALIYEDDAPDPNAAILSNAVVSFRNAGTTALGVPTQFQ